MVIHFSFVTQSRISIVTVTVGLVDHFQLDVLEVYKYGQRLHSLKRIKTVS